LPNPVDQKPENINFAPGSSLANKRDEVSCGVSGSGAGISVSSIAPTEPAYFGMAAEAIGLSPINEGSAVHDPIVWKDYQGLSTTID
jgi:hypothetical protein